jgi:hypothetical protein
MLQSLVASSLSIWPLRMDLAFCYILEKATITNKTKNNPLI